MSCTDEAWGAPVCAILTSPSNAATPLQICHGWTDLERLLGPAEFWRSRRPWGTRSAQCAPWRVAQAALRAATSNAKRLGSGVRPQDWRQGRPGRADDVRECDPGVLPGSDRARAATKQHDVRAACAGGVRASKRPLAVACSPSKRANSRRRGDADGAAACIRGTAVAGQGVRVAALGGASGCGPGIVRPVEPVGRLVSVSRGAALSAFHDALATPLPGGRLALMDTMLEAYTAVRVGWGDGRRLPQLPSPAIERLTETGHGAPPVSR